METKNRLHTYRQATGITLSKLWVGWDWCCTAEGRDSNMDTLENFIKVGQAEIQIH